MSFIDALLSTLQRWRLSFLRRTVGSIVSQPNSRLVVVDYDCPDRCGDWIAAHYPQCGVVRVHDKTFSLARARNLGARAMPADDRDWLCFLDADVVLAPDFCERVSGLAREGTFLICSRGNPGLPGVLIVASADFARGRGTMNGTRGMAGRRPTCAWCSSSGG